VIRPRATSPSYHLRQPHVSALFYVISPSIWVVYIRTTTKCTMCEFEYDVSEVMQGVTHDIRSGGVELHFCYVIEYLGYR
jgi:hypothetical protein